MKRKNIFIAAGLAACTVVIFAGKIRSGFEYALVAAGLKAITCDTRFPTDEAVFAATPDQMTRFVSDINVYADSHKLNHTLSDVKRQAGIEQFLQVYNGDSPLINVFIQEGRIKIMLYEPNDSERRDIENSVKAEFGDTSSLHKIEYNLEHKFRCQ